MIRLEGEIDIAVAAELKAVLLEALASGREISVGLEGVTALDVTAFQLLWAAGREAKQAGRKFRLSGARGEPVRSALASMGLDGLLAG